jgi:hypothetical protein
MRREDFFHFVCAGLERLQQVAMPTLKILQHLRQLIGGGFCTEPQNAINDMVGACLVSGIEIARFCRRLERAHNHPRGIGT